MPVNKIVKCKSCEESITKTRSSILCKACKCWFHMSCAGIDEQYLGVLRSVKAFAYICASCEPNLSENCSTSGVIDKINSLNEKLDRFVLSYESQQSALKTVLEDIKNEVSSCVSEMRSDIQKCAENVQRVERSAATKFVALENEDNILHKRLNRSDILIGGLPEGLEDLEAPVIAIGSFFKVEITSLDINQVCYINRKKQVLVKFNKVSKRDCLMREYFKTRNLKVSDVLDVACSDLSNRVYLNDHFTPAAAHLNAICKKLRQRKVITKFKVLNTDKLRAWLMFTDGKCVTYDAVQCEALLADESREHN